MQFPVRTTSLEVKPLLGCDNIIYMLSNYEYKYLSIRLNNERLLNATGHEVARVVGTRLPIALARVRA
jgi:hypothetical protein